MCASVASQQHGPNRFIVENEGDMLQCDNDQNARVLADDAVVEANEFRRLRAILGFLNGCRRLPERQVNADIVHGQVETKAVLDGHGVNERIVLLTKQLHCILLLILFLDELLAGRVRRVLLVVINVLKLFIVAKEEIANNDLHDLSR
jgi:hypothetical protein